MKRISTQNVAAGAAVVRHLSLPDAAAGRRGCCFVAALALLILAALPPAAAQQGAPAEQTPGLGDPVCAMIESAARANGLPVDFFARVIWQESGFRPDVIGPLTRNGERAEGIAQFMPGTAAERRLFEPFNPVEALPKSGEFLAELRNQFGNLGLAAAAYNAGPQRVREFVAGSRGLPAQTRDYVLAVTGHSVEDWQKPIVNSSGADKGNKLNADTGNRLNDERRPMTCDEMASLLKGKVTAWSSVQKVAAGSSLQKVAAGSGVQKVVALSSVQTLERNVPNWCRALRHPNVSVCGSVHEGGTGMKLSSLARSRPTRER
jgi:hypothetical protein